VQRVLVGPPTRFLAWCHTQNALRWFRLDYAASLSSDESAVFHDVEDDVVDSMVNESVDGFHGRGRARIAFFVRDPDARWVANNLPEGLSGASVDGGFLVETETAGLLPVARFVVGLGGAAECRSPELAALVRELAEGALSGAKQG
jgi:predicted DNA-binding transcriptional regulator YafY